MKTTQTNLKLKLSGENGNVFSIMARAHRVLRRAGLSHLVKPFTDEMTGGDYDHALQVCFRWFDVE